MQYKLIVADIDGTLLNSSGELTQRTIHAIKSAGEKGVLFSVSTGRSIQGIKKFNHILNLKCPVIAYNGAMLAELNTDKIIFEKSLENEAAIKIWEAGQTKNTTICVWSDHKLYTNILNENIQKYKKLHGIEPIFINNIEEILKNKITKILWYDKNENISKWQDEFSKKSFFKTAACTSKPYFLEFFNNEVSKAFTLKKLAKLYNIKKEEIIAIGDGCNDLSMIEYSGLGVAMGNAYEKVKRRSDYITSSNDNDGVAEVIEKFIL